MNPEKLLSEIKPKDFKKEKPPVLNEPIGDVDYFKEGDVSVENEKVRVEFNFSFADYARYEEGLLSQHPLSSDEFRKLNKLIVADKKTGKAIDILDKLPEGYTVLFNPFSGVHYSRASFRHKGCIILENIASAKGILMTAHEVGHCVDYEKTDDKKRNSCIETVTTEEEINAVLQKEWAAWSFALNKIRPLLRSGAFPKEEILKNIHGMEGLLSYCLGAKNVLEWIKKNKEKELDEFYAKLHELTGY